MLTLSLLKTDADWFLELADALDEAVMTREEDQEHVQITEDLAKQISRYIKVIIHSAERQSPDS